MKLYISLKSILNGYIGFSTVSKTTFLPRPSVCWSTSLHKKLSGPFSLSYGYWLVTQVKQCNRSNIVL